MEKYSWLLITEKYIDGTYRAYTERLKNCDNLWCFLQHAKREYKDIKSVNVCDSKKFAEETCQYWNECYKQNGTLHEFDYKLGY